MKLFVFHAYLHDDFSRHTLLAALHIALLFALLFLLSDCLHFHFLFSLSTSHIYFQLLP